MNNEKDEPWKRWCSTCLPRHAMRLMLKAFISNEALDRIDVDSISPIGGASIEKEINISMGPMRCWH